MPGVRPTAVQTRHGRLPSLHAAVMGLGVALGEKLALERDHSGDGTTRLLSHGP